MLWMHVRLSLSFTNQMQDKIKLDSKLNSNCWYKKTEGKPTPHRLAVLYLLLQPPKLMGTEKKKWRYPVFYWLEDNAVVQ